MTFNQSGTTFRDNSTQTNIGTQNNFAATNERTSMSRTRRGVPSSSEIVETPNKRGRGDGDDKEDARQTDDNVSADDGRRFLRRKTGSVNGDDDSGAMFQV
jgi:hypothetical protein